MRVEKESESPDSEGASHQKQDPLERRRLQNRLSQRNHRRKIRDRIAKLQERVIANELRAAAALNGWDQPFPTSPLISNRRMAQPDPGLGMSAQDPRQFAADPSPALVSSYGLSMVPSWSGHLQTLPPQTQIPEESSYLSTRGTVSAESICSTSNLTGPNLMTSRGFEVCSSTHDGQMISQMSNNGTTAPFEPFTTGLVNQPLYYVTTENGLPQILQTLNTVAPQSKIIVLVSPEWAVGSGAVAGNSVSSSLPLGNHGLDLDPLSFESLNPPNLTYQRSPPINHPVSTAPVKSRAWVTLGSCLPGCSLNKM